MSNRSRPWTDQASCATTLVTAYADAFGEPGSLVPVWDRDTVVAEIIAEFGVEPSRAILDRLMTGIVLVTTDRFYKSLMDFVMFAPVLSGGVLDPATPDFPDAAECAWGITEALLLSPPDQGDDEPFCDEIRHYLGHVLADEGITNPPDVLAIAIMPTAMPGGAVGADAAAFEHAKCEEIRDIVRDGLSRLLDQLENLELHTGDVRNLTDRLRQRGVH